MRERTASVVFVLAVFAVVAGVYSATYGFRGITDTTLNSLQTRALVLHGDIDLARYGIRPNDFGTRDIKQVVERGGHLYSVYGVGTSLTAAPFYAFSARTGVSDESMQAIAAIAYTAGAAAIIGLLLFRLAPRRVAVVCLLVFAFGTTAWPVASRALFQQGPLLFFESVGISGLLSRRRMRPAMAGIGFGVATLVRSTAVITLAVVGLFYLARNRRWLFTYSVAALAPVAALVVQNRWIWGTWINGGYSYHGVPFNAPFGEAFGGLTIGWWRGLLIYTPYLALGLLGWLIALRHDGEVERALAFLGISTLVTLLVYSKWADWGGGINQFGYRLPLELVPALLILAAYALTRVPRLFSIGTALGVVSVVTMTWGAAPRRDGFDDVLFAHRIRQTSLWRSWRNFFDHPGPGLLRLALVAAAASLVAWLLFRLQGHRSTGLFGQSRTSPATDAA